MLGGKETTAKIWDPKLSQLKQALSPAVAGIQSWGAAIAQPVSVPPEDRPAALPPEWARQATARLREAAELGDVTGLVSAAGELTADCEAFAPFGSRVIELANDFEFDAIIELADKLAADSG